MIKYDLIKKNICIFRRLFGINPVEFEELLAISSSLWEKEVVGNYKRPGRFPQLTLREMILLLLLYYRHYITQEFVGMLFNHHKANVCRIIQKLEPVLLKVMKLPERDGLSEEEVHNLILDATDNQIERPKRNQEKYYSGKKKRHTIKTEIRVTKRGRIIGVSETVPGTVHDFKLLENGEEIPQGVWALGDSGYEGIKNINEKSKIPHKKPKGKELTKSQKEENAALSKVRVIVENIIGDIKTFRIMSYRYRNKRIRFNEKFRIIAGIVNVKNGFGFA